MSVTDAPAYPRIRPPRDVRAARPGRYDACVDVSRAAEGSFEGGDDGRFIGEVWLCSTLADEAGTNVGVVHFSPGARTHWHRHSGGQFLYAVTGRGRVRTRGEAGHVLEPGDVIHVGDEEYAEGL